MATSKLFIIVVVLICKVSINNICSRAAILPPAKFSTAFLFGDSTVDTGNNNYIRTFLRASTPPYGKNFPGQVPTGRFSDGKIVVDVIASSLRIKDYVPPFLGQNLSEIKELRTGVSFASAGSGYDELTAKLFNVIPVSKQVEMFKSYIEKLEGIVGKDEAKNIIGEAVVGISAGSDDLILNYYVLPIRQLEFDMAGYQGFLLQKLEDSIKELYKLGCRKMMVVGLPPIGCLPLQITTKLKITGRKCLEDQNSDARSYNNKLAELLPKLEAKLPGSKIVYANIYDTMLDMINHPQQYGFVETKRGCCGTGLLETTFLCNPLIPICKNISQFLFWDSVHPTQQAQIYLANYILKKFIPLLLDI